MRPGHKLAKGKGRNFIIFEAILPNPSPKDGLKACYPIAKMWHDFTFMSDAAMAAQLEEFYFKGVYGFPPVVHPHHYGLMLGANGYACSSGQIRTNQFNADPWDMREFKLSIDCRCGTCHLRMLPITVKTNPYADLFNASTPEPLAPMLQSTIVAEVHNLSQPDANLISWAVDDKLNAAESPINGFSDYVGQASGNAALHAAITAALPIGSPLNSTNIIDRALTQSCAGCHELSNGRDLGGGVTWPFSLGFTHISEFKLASGHFPISDALKNVFIPFREKILLTYLANPGQFTFGSEKCELQLPPSMQVDEKICQIAIKDPKILLEKIDLSAVRTLREKWEGERILGRRSGHCCHLELPPELQVPPPLCDPHGDGGSGGGSDDGDVVIEVPFRVLELLKHPELLRDLRVRWEGDAILGRRSAH